MEHTSRQARRIGRVSEAEFLAWAQREIGSVASRLSSDRRAEAVSLAVHFVKESGGNLSAARIALHQLLGESVFGGPLGAPAVLSAALALVEKRIQS